MKKITPVIKKIRIIEEPYEVCPHCNKEIREKEHFVDEENYVYHRGCYDKGPIDRIKPISEEELKNMFGLGEGNIEKKCFNIKKWKQERYAQSSRPKDTANIPLGLKEQYILKLKWKYIKSNEEPYFFGGGSFYSPEMVFLPNEAHIFKGAELIDSNVDWYNKYDAVRMKNYEN